MIIYLFQMKDIFKEKNNILFDGHPSIMGYTRRAEALEDYFKDFFRKGFL